ncbi:MAG: peptidoglycan-binding protein [Rhodovarius sp.]|nr:peptidoglycan-binding protein [Rhodovarius sp.]
MIRGRLRGGAGAGAGYQAWPGYVDALSSLLMLITFVLLAFVLAQGFLSAALASRDQALAQLRREVAALSASLALERQSRAEALAALGTAEGRAVRAEEEAAALAAAVAGLRADLARLNAALGQAEAARSAGEREIVALRERLTAALAARIEELQAYRSDFFGRLRQVLGDRPEIRVVGDRFVLQSEVLFPPGSAEPTPAGERQLRELARVLLDIAARIPPDVPWVLRIDGHADRTPIRTPRFASNWELSAARAIAVAQRLIEAGLPPERIAAAAFGEYQPIDPGDSPEARARNRRIELRLTDR